MKIIGFAINRVSAEKTNPVKGKVEVKSGLDIEDIKEEKTAVSEKSTLKFDFSYRVDFNPRIAEILIKGTVIVLDEKNEGKEIMKDWKEKKFNHPLKLPLMNFILDKCNLRALELEEEIGLPFHLPFPKLRAKKAATQATYTG